MCGMDSWPKRGYVDAWRIAPLTLLCCVRALLAAVLSARGLGDPLGEEQSMQSIQSASTFASGRSSLSRVDHALRLLKALKTAQIAVQRPVDESAEPRPTASHSQVVLLRRHILRNAQQLRASCLSLSQVG